MPDAAEHLPTVYVTRMARQHPGCWQEVDQLRAMRGAELPDWPPWCFLPLAAAYAILSRGERLTPEGAAEIAAFGALAAWRTTQGIYEIHPAIRAAIEETQLEGAIPVDVLHRLPEWCVYVRTPGMRFGDADAAGFFAYLEADANTGREELRLVVDCPPILHGIIPVHLDRGGLEIGVAAAKAEAARNAIGTDMEGAVGALPSSATMAAVLAPMVNLVLYVCAENSEIRDRNGRREKPTNPGPIRTGRGARLFPPDHPTTWDVGSRTGAALEAASAAEGEPRGGTHAAPRAHIRRAHWHHYWTGPREHQQASLRWLAPIAVNVSEERPLVPTIRPVKGEES